jgi:hypothetical protein
MKSTTEKLLKLMNVLAWIVLIALIVVIGSILISYVVSIGNPQAAKDLYRGMDLYAYRQHSFVNYTFIVGYKVLLLMLQVYIAFLMTRLLSRLNIARPFNPTVVKVMERTSYSILSLWLVAMAYNVHIAILAKSYGLVATYTSGDFLFLSGLAYILAQMFKRGLTIQSENELTI